MPPITKTALSFAGQKLDSNVYTYNRAPQPAELRYLRRMIEQRYAILTNKVLGDVGEHYVTAWLQSTGQFDEITGKLKHKGKNEVDGTAREIVTGTRYAISVKNRREWLRPDDSAIDNVVAMCIAHGGIAPWLIVTHAQPEAIQRCRDSRIRVTVLNKQILPETITGKRNGPRLRTIIPKLRPVLGPEPFGYIGVRADRTDFSGHDDD